MGRPFLCLLYTNGNIIDGEDGVGYDRRFYKNLRITDDDIEFSKFKSKIARRLNCDLSTHDLKINHRFPEIIRGEVRFTLTDIEDDDDVEGIVGLLESRTDNYMPELYVEVIKKRNDECNIHDSHVVEVTCPTVTQVENDYVCTEDLEIDREEEAFTNAYSDECVPSDEEFENYDSDDDNTHTEKPRK